MPQEGQPLQVFRPVVALAGLAAGWAVAMPPSSWPACAPGLRRNACSWRPSTGNWRRHSNAERLAFISADDARDRTIVRSVIQFLHWLDIDGRRTISASRTAW